MKIIKAKKSIKFFRNHPKISGLLVEREFRISKERVWARLVVFENRSSLRKFWKQVLGLGDIGSEIRGAVYGLEYERISFRKGKEEDRCQIIDPRLYCIIALVKGDLTMEIICHEALHAGARYAQRIKKPKGWLEEVREEPEEALAYPTGKIASHIYFILNQHNLI